MSHEYTQRYCVTRNTFFFLYCKLKADNIFDKTSKIFVLDITTFWSCIELHCFPSNIATLHIQPIYILLICLHTSNFSLLTEIRIGVCRKMNMWQCVCLSICMNYLNCLPNNLHWISKNQEQANFVWTIKTYSVNFM